MNFLDELRWRGMLHDATPGLEELLSNETVCGYIGFDPTAPSLTIGNYVQVMLLTLFQKAGHKPIVLMGGATGRIGDPSGKDQERTLKSTEELDGNLAHQVAQFKKLIQFDTGENAAEMVNNFDFYRDMNVLDFLRNVGKTLTVNYMLTKDAVKNRMETGISFTEFSYQLLQGYDFQCLYEQKNCILQMGGSDQWGNITSGIEFIRRNSGGKAYAVTTPLLTKSDGKKFGKSEKGNIWLDANLTSPYQFYQFWINTDDADLKKFFRYFSLKSREEIEQLENEHVANPIPLKKALAEELTIRIHGQAAFESALRVSELLFNPKASQETLFAMDETELATVYQEIPAFELNAAALPEEVNIVDLLCEHTTILQSKGEARRAIQAGAISVNKEKISSAEATVAKSQWLHGQYLMLDNGKKNKYILKRRV